MTDNKEILAAVTTLGAALLEKLTERPQIVTIPDPPVADPTEAVRKRMTDKAKANPYGPYGTMGAQAVVRNVLDHETMSLVDSLKDLIALRVVEDLLAAGMLVRK